MAGCTKCMDCGVNSDRQPCDCPAGKAWAEHQREIARIYSELAKRQEPLGAEFEKVLNENLETLYEN